MKDIWVISDTHFGHDKIVEYCGRPKDHGDLMLYNISTLPSLDILIHCGDVCIGDDFMWNMIIAKRTWAYKWLVRGNHDKKSICWYLNHGWHCVVDSLMLKIYGKRILFSHKPQPDDGSFDLNIHGHLHNNMHRLSDPEVKTVVTDKHLNFSVEERNYRPVKLKTLVTEFDRRTK